MDTPTNTVEEIVAAPTGVPIGDIPDLPLEDRPATLAEVLPYMSSEEGDKLKTDAVAKLTAIENLAKTKACDSIEHKIPGFKNLSQYKRASIYSTFKVSRTVDKVTRQEIERLEELDAKISKYIKEGKLRPDYIERLRAGIQVIFLPWYTKEDVLSMQLAPLKRYCNELGLKGFNGMRLHQIQDAYAKNLYKTTVKDNTTTDKDRFYQILTRGALEVEDHQLIEKFSEDFRDLFAQY